MEEWWVTICICKIALAGQSESKELNEYAIQI